ncbi:C40 family peptidase [Sphaerisporangium sp. NPDC005288]|uniref:C40 family peptidase n=1 Tax=Sphaerisporangium sp. NPDC005288 TaxID=3155114 RepID=UPI0033B4632F
MSGRVIITAVVFVSAPLTLVLGIALGSASGPMTDSPLAGVEPACQDTARSLTQAPDGGRSDGPHPQAPLTAATPTCPPPIPPGDTGRVVLAQAQKWIGVAYQYGGGDQNGPTVGTNSNGSGEPGFDCSGLTVWAVYQATNGKVLLPRTAATQFHDRRWRHVPYDQLQVGDLVFWPGSSGTRTAPSHVGIYAGDQRFFNAPFTGAKLRFDSMAPGTYRYQTFIAGARITG